MSNSNRSKAMIGGACATAALIGSVVGPETAHAEPQGYIQDELGVGYVYGTFNEGPNFTLLAGGSVEEFCLSFPDDPGVAPMRVFPRNDGTVDLKVNDKDQPIYLYEQTVGDGFDWLDSVCADLFDGDPNTVAPAPYASGAADLKVRINGEMVGSDGTEYRVRASADLIIGMAFTSATRRTS